MAVPCAVVVVMLGELRDCQRPVPQEKKVPGKSIKIIGVSFLIGCIFGGMLGMNPVAGGFFAVVARIFYAMIKNVNAIDLEAEFPPAEEHPNVLKKTPPALPKTGAK